MTALHAAGFLKYPGDVNTDRQIDVADGVLLARYCVEDLTVVITDEGICNADADGNQQVNAADTVCVLRMIAGMIPMPMNPYAAESRPETGLPETTALPAETAPAETAPETNAADVQNQTSEHAVLTADQKSYPLGVSISVLSLDAQPAETLTVQYQDGNVVFAVYAAEPEYTAIAFAQNDDIFGYYILCSEYSAPEGYNVQEMRDQHEQNRLYAILVQEEGKTISFSALADRSDMHFLSKLAFYATNGIRAVNELDGYIWDEELAKAALAHSREMADNDFCDHNSLDGTKFGDRLLNFGIDWQACAENIDFGYLDPFSAVNGWYNSKSGHRNNLLSRKYERVGIGFAYGAESEYLFYGTQDFYCRWK